MKDADILKKPWVLLRNCFLCLLISILTACASSPVSKDAANQVDSAYQNGTSFISHIGDNGLQSYPNTSAVVQGAASGAVVGGATAGFLSGGAYGSILLGGASGAILGGVLGAYLVHNSSLVEQLENHGAKVFVLGDQIMIVIPTLQVFRDGTPTMFPRADNTFDLIARLVNGYHTMMVKVNVYSDGAVSNKVYMAITQEQANAILKYLWPRVNTRVVSAKGYGNSNLVEEPGGPNNARIEIVLEKLPV